MEIYLNHLKIKAKDGELFKLLPIHKAANGDLISINENTFLGHTSNTLPNEMRAEIKFLPVQSKQKHEILKEYVGALTKLKELEILLDPNKNNDEPTKYSKEIFLTLKSVKKHHG